MSNIVKAKLINEAYKTIDIKKQGLWVIQQNHENDTRNFEKNKEELIRQSIKKSKYIENEAIKRADDLIQKATVSCREIAVTAEQKGYEDGYIRGLVDGTNASCLTVEEGFEEIRNLIELIKKEKQEAFKREEKHMLAISFELATKIMKQAIQMDEGIVEKMLEEIISENEGKIKISMSEYQKTLDIKVDKNIAKKIKDFSKEAKVVFVKEEDLITLETANGVIDISIPTQIEHLKNALDIKN